MKKPLVVIVASLVAVVVLVTGAQAQSLRTLQDRRVLQLNIPAPLPRLVAGDRIEIDDPLPRDLMAAGGQVVVGGPVDGDVYIGGGQIELVERVEGNLLVGGGQVLIDAPVAGDVLVGGGRVRLGESARVGGYLLVLGGQIEILGTVDGSALLMGGNVEVRQSASVGGNLTVQSEESVVSDEAKIGGEKSISKPPRAPGFPALGKKAAAKTIAGVKLGSALFGFFSQLLVLVVGIYFFGKHLRQLSEYVLKSPLSMAGWGLVKLVVTPIVVLLLLITVVGLPLGLLIALAYAAKLYLAKLVVAVALGQWMVKRGWIGSKSSYVQAALGLLVFTGLKLLPLVGGLVGLAALLLGLGAFLTWDRKVWLKPS